MRQLFFVFCIYPLYLSEQDTGANGENRKSGIVRLSAIRDIMERGLHALLDVTPNAVDKLNYAQFYPIVLLARADTKQTIKDCRAGLPKWVVARVGFGYLKDASSVVNNTFIADHLINCYHIMLYK